MQDIWSYSIYNTTFKSPSLNFKKRMKTFKKERLKFKKRVRLYFAFLMNNFLPSIFSSLSLTLRLQYFLCFLYRNSIQEDVYKITGIMRNVLIGQNSAQVFSLYITERIIWITIKLKYKKLVVITILIIETKVVI